MIFLYIFFRRIINAITQMTTENKDPAAVASPIGRSVVEKSADIRYAPGTPAARQPATSSALSSRMEPDR